MDPTGLEPVCEWNHRLPFLNQIYRLTHTSPFGVILCLTQRHKPSMGFEPMTL